MSISEKEISLGIAEHIHAEQISLLYSGSLSRPLLHVISLIMFLLIIIKHVNPIYAYTWAILVLGLNICRYLDLYKTQKILHKIKNYKVVHMRYALCSGLLGAVYGLGYVFFFSQLPIINHIYLILLITAMVPAGLVSFASDKLSFNLYLYSISLPIIIKMFVEGQIEYFNIGVCAIIFVLTINKLHLWNYNVITYAIRLKFENEELLVSLQTINTRLVELSVIDDLTQVANRRSLDDNLEREWLRAKRISKPISMLMIDVDYFKQYNDEFGHIKGDECLIYIAGFMKNNLNRPGDFVARYGGEEFCIIMPDTNFSGAVDFAEKLHSGIRELKIPNPKSTISKYLTVSIGVTSVIPTTGETYMDLIYTSDRALYNAKNSGRNIIRSSEILERNPKPQLVI